MNGNEVIGTDIVIWGTKALGNMAYYYYENKCNILCYIDNNERKWGNTLNGIKICPPSVLHEMKATVVLAMKYGIEAVSRQLYEDFAIKSFIQFQINEEVHMLEDCLSAQEAIQEDTCIISFSGGLGNQMFQYAFLKNLEIQGKNVLADLERYMRLGVMDFQLLDVFGNINLKICTKNQKIKLIEKNTEQENKLKKFIIYFETVAFEPDRRKKADLSLLDMTGGIIVGKHQSYQFAEQIRENLLNDFAFPSSCERKLEMLRDNMLEKNAVSIHIRRGDYLSEYNKWSYGDICTSQYYENAINYISERTGDCIFYFFSDDIEWVKEHYDRENAVFISEKMFDDYHDWYDMYLMSICKHNIIANSTFSWWGAWLNQNEEKIVIAPKKWIHTYDYEDIYPVEWIQL